MERKVAIPVFGNRVSPRCEYAGTIIVLHVSDDREQHREVVTTKGLNAMQVINHLSDLGVTEFVCTGVSGFARRMMEANGIRIRLAQGYEVEEVIEEAMKFRPPDMDGNAGRRGKGQCGVRRGGISGGYASNSPARGRGMKDNSGCRRRKGPGNREGRR